MLKENIKRLSLSMRATGANLRARIIARFLIGLLVFATCATDRLTHAQYCNPAVVSYIVRDEEGRVIDGVTLKSVAEQLPRSIGDAQTEASQTSFADDGKTFYWPESIAWAKGKMVPSLQFINAGTCVMHLTEVTLTYHNKKMRLIFNLEITRAQSDRRPVIDSLAFQEGAFVLDLNGWSHERDKMIPSTRWKKVKD